ncbi:YARHG domain-containing protein [Qipengyuania sp. ASV99]|uniref:YARHG domain-containing protein n=1 Tax=Qipengyuania sp. ASV99 TaxID=3399681 RepID=UPI003A4C6B2A
MADQRWGVAVVDVFVSYSRADAEKVGMLARMIASEGYQVWWDADLPPHMSYGDVITAKIGAAKAAVVVWSETAAKSEWVRAEADVARNQKKLIQTSIGEVLPPLPFNQIQCASIGDWNGESDHPGWSKVKQSLAALCGPRGSHDGGSVSAPPADIAHAPPPPSPSPPSPQYSPAPQAAPHTASNWPIIAGLVVALIAILAAVLIVLFGLGAREDDSGKADDEPVVEAADYAAQAEEAGETAATGSSNEPVPSPVPDRREWLFATVEDADGFSNVRARPTTRSPIVGTVREGESFSTWRQDGSWWQVELSDGSRGFIYRRLIRLLGNDTARAPENLPQVPVGPGGMVFADSSTRQLDYAELAGLNAGALRIARNEIYARRGFRFEDDALRSYFSRFDWYSPRTDTVNLNAIEQRNIELISEAEARLAR